MKTNDANFENIRCTSRFDCNFAPEALLKNVEKVTTKGG